MTPRILSLDEAPFHELSYMNAMGGGTPLARRSLRFLRGIVNELPSELDAIVAASDLQGREVAGGRLLGEMVAEELAALGKLGVIPPPQRMAVLLAGDLFTVLGLDHRGKIGDVRSVWTAFMSRFAWVAGVTGNHDCYGPKDPSGRTFRKQPGVHLLDGTVADLHGLAIGGVSVIVGPVRKLARKDLADFLALVSQLLSRHVDVMLLHEGPDAPDGLRGNAEVRMTLERSIERPLVVCGHCYWPSPLATLASGAQVLNVDARVVVLVREGSAMKR